jgi:hypothetical protein
VKPIRMFHSALGSLIAESWNPLIESLRRLASLRETLDLKAIASRTTAQRGRIPARRTGSCRIVYIPLLCGTTDDS